MKKLLILFSAAWLSILFANAQQADSTAYYTVVYNRAPHKAQYPLIGLVNVGLGDHSSLQMGILNYNRRHFTGLQLGLTNVVRGATFGVQTGIINTTGVRLSGAQIGVINVSHGSSSGLKFGFVNVNKGLFQGVQLGFSNINANGLIGFQVGFFNRAENVFGYQAGFVNISGGNEMALGIQSGFLNITSQKFLGIQTGLVNINKSLEEFSVFGAQVGFMNLVKKEMIGLQLGYINASQTLSGFQLGLVNRSSKLSGFQLGVVNVTDSITWGIPIGFLSFVKRGGYKAIELGVSEFSPVSVAFKTGTEHFYTGLQMGYFSEKTSIPFIFGWLAGSRLRLIPNFFFNPEFIFSSTRNPAINLEYAALRLQMCYQPHPKISFLAGPSFVSALSNEAVASYLELWRTSVGADKALLLSGRIAMVYRID